MADAGVVKDKNGRLYDTHITALKYTGDRPSGWVIVLHDITTLKDAEARASQLAAVIEQAYETVMITDLDSKTHK